MRLGLTYDNESLAHSGGSLCLEFHKDKTGFESIVTVIANSEHKSLEILTILNDAIVIYDSRNFTEHSYCAFKLDIQLHRKKIENSNTSH